jgi:hypothetical protein
MTLPSASQLPALVGETGLLTRLRRRTAAEVTRAAERLIGLCESPQGVFRAVDCAWRRRGANNCARVRLGLAEAFLIRAPRMHRWTGDLCSIAGAVLTNSSYRLAQEGVTGGTNAALVRGFRASAAPVDAEVPEAGGWTDPARLAVRRRRALAGAIDTDADVIRIAFCIDRRCAGRTIGTGHAEADAVDADAVSICAAWVTHHDRSAGTALVERSVLALTGFRNAGQECALGKLNRTCHRGPGYRRSCRDALLAEVLRIPLRGRIAFAVDLAGTGRASAVEAGFIGVAGIAAAGTG